MASRPCDVMRWCLTCVALASAGCFAQVPPGKQQFYQPDPNREAYIKVLVPLQCFC